MCQYIVLQEYDVGFDCLFTSVSWFSFKMSNDKFSPQATATANGEPFTYLTTEESESGDIEPVPPELKGREAIRIEDLHKTFKTCFKPGVKAVNGKSYHFEIQI